VESQLRNITEMVSLITTTVLRKRQLGLVDPLLRCTGNLMPTIGVGMHTDYAKLKTRNTGKSLRNASSKDISILQEIQLGS